MKIENQLVLTLTTESDEDIQAWRRAILKAVQGITDELPTPKAGPHITTRSYPIPDDQTEPVNISAVPQRAAKKAEIAG